SVPFSMDTYFIFTSSFTYRSIAAFLLACNTPMCTSSATASPLFAGWMYHILGTVCATLLLGVLTTAKAPLPYV
ncbi:hypothetical protein BGW80DRAFT_1151026, partial [Lactifluus volemus]